MKEAPIEIHATVKGQIVIPSRLRRKYGIKAGTRIEVSDDGKRIVLQPITRDYIRSLRGVMKGSGALAILEDERRRERERERGKKA
jgi:AbrB family looped-hinge helix DNA binding protein